MQLIDAQQALEDLAIAAGKVEVAIAEKDASLSALSLERDSLSAANISLQSQLDTARQEIADLKAKIPPEPVPVAKTVLDYGAVGDGIADDTAAIQKAIDAGDGRFPEGKRAFLINPLRVPSGTSFYGLYVGAGKRLELGPETVLVCKPNAAPRYCMVRVEGGHLIGAVDENGKPLSQIIGDRRRHTFTAGSTHEWGYGFQTRGTGSRVTGIRVLECTGDGCGASGADCEIRNVISTQNRRQGLSIFTIKGLRVYDSEFTKTGALDGQAGTNPRCGVDIEPDSGWAEDVLFDNCTIEDNEVTGLVGWIRSEVNGGIRGLVVKNCRIAGVNAIHFKALRNSITASVEGCTIKRTKSDRGNGLKVETGATIAASGNTFGGVTARTPFEVTGRSSRTSADIATPAQDPGQSLGVVDAGTNRYV